MVIAVLVLQAAGFVILYLVLRRVLLRRMNSPEIVSEVRNEVAALIAELNGTTERNVALLEDRVRHLHELLGRGDGGSRGGAHGPATERSADRSGNSFAERRTEVLRLRRMGMSNDAIVEHLATSPGEVELIVNLAESAPDLRR